MLSTPEAHSKQFYHALHYASLKRQRSMRPNFAHASGSDQQAASILLPPFGDPSIVMKLLGEELGLSKGPVLV